MDWEEACAEATSWEIFSAKSLMWGQGEFNKRRLQSSCRQTNYSVAGCFERQAKLTSGNNCNDYVSDRNKKVPMLQVLLCLQKRGRLQMMQRTKTLHSELARTEWKQFQCIKRGHLDVARYTGKCVTFTDFA